MPVPELPRSIDEVIDALTGIVETARVSSSRLGYFPALYRKVTVRVRARIADGGFDDGARMDALDVRFANRYLAAYAAYRGGRPTTDVWRRAFDAADDWWPIVLQHLLLGIHAHINLDLGVAVAQTVDRDALPRFRPDFDRINDLLADLVGEVQQELADIWWALRLVDRVLGDADTGLINFSLRRAREQAWDVATRLAALPAPARAHAIARLDTDLTELARIIRHPGALLTAVTVGVRLGERGSTAEKIAILE